MIMEIDFYLYVILIHKSFLIQADQLCYYYNQSTILSIYCKEKCCSGTPMSPQTACCASMTWSTLAIPVLIVTSVCIIALCSVYFRPLLKLCICGCRCPCRSQSRVTSPSPMSVNDNPVYIMNHGDLPDYETVVKDSPVKEITPPPYNFVAAHATDFGIETRIPSAPPQYHSRRNSVTAEESTARVES